MTQNRIRRLAVTSAVGAVVVASAVTPAAAAAVTASARVPAVAVVSTQTGQPGRALLVSGSTPSSASASAPALAQNAPRPRGARRPPSAASPRASAAVAAPLASAGTAASTAALLKTFNGTSSRDSQFTNYNATFEPPDQGLCVGAGYVLEPVNSAYRIFTTAGKSIRGPFNVNDLFNEGGKEFTSDPRCWYDPATHSWFAVILFLNASSTEGRIDIAVNPTPNPTGQWTEYQIDNTFDGRNGEPNLPGCPCFGDQPRLGIDQTNLYVTTDEYSIIGPQYYGGQIYAISKADLVKGVSSPHFVRFGNLVLGGAMAGAPQPALSVGSPDAEYFLSQLDPNGTGDDRIGLWAMTARSKVGRGQSPVLSKLVISAEPYSVPPPAAQQGSTSRLDSGDDRMQQASWVNGTVWGTLGTSLRPAGDSTDRAGIAWFQVRPTLTGGHLSSVAIVRQGYLAASGESLIYPALQPDAAGNAAVVFTDTSSHRYPSAAYAVLKAGAAGFSAPMVVASGAGPYDKTATRWGDYSFAVPDWTADAAWLATEYVPARSSQTTTGARNWGTQVLRVRLG
jgi:hypothetical protein